MKRATNPDGATMFWLGAALCLAVALFVSSQGYRCTLLMLAGLCTVFAFALQVGWWTSAIRPILLLILCCLGVFSRMH